MSNQTIFGENVEKMSVSELFERKSDPACREEIILRYLPKMKEKAYAESKTLEEYEELYSYLSEVLIDSADKWEEDLEHIRKYRYFSVYLGTRVNNFLKMRWQTLQKRKDRLVDDPSINEFYHCDSEEEKWEPDDRLVADDRSEAVYWLLAHLRKNEYDVIVTRYFGRYTLDETAKLLGKSRERVRQIEAKALRRMREYCSRMGMLAFDLLG